MAEKDKGRISTGISGLDEILHEGLIRNRVYLVRGGPGCGKTTIGFHFLKKGISIGEKSLFISMGESEENLKEHAMLQGIDLNGVHFLDLSLSGENGFTQNKVYDIFSPADVEKDDIANRIIETIQSTKPERVFIDSVTHFQYLIPDMYLYRKQILLFMSFIIRQKATALVTTESSAETPDDSLQYLCDGIINLENTINGRYLTVRKFRGSNYHAGRHSFKLSDCGMLVFPKLVPSKHRKEFFHETISSGLTDIDNLLNGGIERGTVTILTGPSGVGKTTLGFQFLRESAEQGEKSVAYLFEESPDTVVARSAAVNMPIENMVKNKNLRIRKIEPLTYSPDQFAMMVRNDVDGGDASVIMIDSVIGYRLSMESESELVSHLHALCKYLTNSGITVILINETENITGDFASTEKGISYLADNVIFMRYLEYLGELRKTIGVMKKRLSNFEKTIRQFRITDKGIVVGDPLTHLRGILSGMPEIIKSSEEDNV